jgi:hypothetical protein
MSISEPHLAEIAEQMLGMEEFVGHSAPTPPAQSFSGSLLDVLAVGIRTCGM